MKRFICITVFFACIAFAQALRAQVSVSIRIAPPYPNRITDYESRPQQVLITLINQSVATQNIQLRASVVGDNGIRLEVGRNYRSASAITLVPGQVRNLNGADLVTLFDYNQIIYTGITKDEFIRGNGLPEGSYQVCMRAYDYNTGAPISGDEPVGCSNRFSISSLEPPLVIKPFDGDEIKQTNGNIFTINWTTPAGSPPSTRYKIRIIEVLGNRNPNDAYLSALSPYFFEKEVMGNVYVYNPSDPQLTKGRKYAFTITAFDPNNGYSFRNNGISQVTSFTFGSAEQELVSNPNKPEPSPDKPKKPMTTNTVKGRVLWAFKATEESYFGNTSFGKSNTGAGNLTAVLKMPDNFPVAGLIQNNTLTNNIQNVASTTKNNTNGVVGGIVYNAFNPLTDNPNNVLKVVSVDKTVLSASAGNSYISAIAPSNSGASLSSSIFVTGHQKLDFSNDAATPTASSNKMPLAGATVKIIGVENDFPAPNNSYNSNLKNEQNKNQQEANSKFGIFDLNAKNSPSKNNTTPQKPSGNNSKDIINPNAVPNLIASGRTDADGNFTINFADLNYSGGNNYKKVKIVITKGVLEETKIIDANQLLKPTVDLGEMICLASTYRFTPTIEMPDIAGSATDVKRIVVKIYRQQTESAVNSYLDYDGNLSPDRKIKEVIGGKNMVLIAVDSNMTKSSAQFKFGKLFEDVDYTVILNSGNNIDKRTGSLKLAKLESVNNSVANIKPTYTLTASPPSIIGTVQLALKNGFTSVKNAVVKIEFNESDLETATVNSSSLNNVTATNHSSALVNSMNSTNANFASTTIGLNTSATVKTSTVNSYYNSPATSSVLAGGTKSLSTTVNSAALSASVNSGLVSYIAPYTGVTDEMGNYVINNLPKLKEGKSFTVKLIKVPAEFKNLLVEPGESVVVNRVLAGEQKDVSFKIKPELVQVVGRVVTDDKKTINNARLNFEGATDMFTSGSSGLFSTVYFPGTHYLIVKKEGYADARVQVVITAKSTGNNPNSGGNTNAASNVLESNHLFNVSNQALSNSGAKITQNTQANTVDLSIQMLNTPTVSKQTSGGAAFSPLLFGVASSSSEKNVNNSGIKSLATTVSATVTNNASGAGKTVDFKANPSSSTAQLSNISAVDAMAQVYSATALTSSNYGSNTQSTLDLGDVGFLKRKVGKIRFKITDADANVIIAQAKIKLFDTVGLTDSKGEWFYEGFGGQVKVTVLAPDGSAYIATEESLLITEDGIEAVKNIKLQKGVKVNGFVRNSGNPIAGATLKVEEKPYLLTTSDANGAYSLYIPKGSFQLKASKSGYVSNLKPLNAGSVALQADFELTDGGGKNIAKILGFEIELDKMVAEGTGYRISGAVVNLVPALTDLKLASNLKLNFSNVKVNFDASNNAIPEGNKLITDELSISFKLLNFIPVILKSPNGIAIEADGNGAGKIAGELMANFEILQGNRGWGFNKIDTKILPENFNPGTALTLFSSSGNPVTNSKYKIKNVINSLEGNLFGFKIAVSTDQSFIDKEGLHLVGNIQTPDLGVIKSATLKVEELFIGSDLLVKKVNVSQNNLPALTIVNWTAKLESLLFNEDGFKIGGSIAVKVPASGTSTVNFSDVSIAKDMLFGGNFYIPENGIDIFNIVSLKKGSAPISFGQVPNQTGVYRLGGSGKIKFSKLITSEINIPVFEVHTNGRFLVDAPTNFETDLQFVKLKVQSIKFDNTGTTPFIGVQGALSVDVPILKLTAADIAFKNTGNGVSFSIGKIKASLDVPVLKTEIEVDMKDNGFEGAGKLGIPGTPINAGINFHYFKVNGGVDFGAKFSAGVVIPIGFVTIERVGGGFSYNTASKDFMVDINGAVSIANMGALVKLDPIGLTVRSGPVIEGYATVVVGSTLNLARASMKLDFPQETFSVTVDASIEPIKGVAKAKLQGDLIISLKKDDRFAFLGCGMEVNLLGLIKSNGEFALGVGVRNPITRGDRVSYYFRNVDTKYVRDVFSGVYINATAKMGIPENRAVGFDFLIASAKLWFYTESNAKLILNFAENNYLFGLSGQFGGGFDFCIAKIACAGFGYKACYEFMGGRNDTDGWFISGSAAGKVSLKVGGCNPGCNDWELHPFCAGFKLCASGGAKVAYRQNGGLQLGVFVGGTPLCP